MIILNEFGRDAGRLQSAAAPGFRKEAARVAMDLRNEELNLRDTQRRYFHNAILTPDRQQITTKNRISNAISRRSEVSCRLPNIYLVRIWKTPTSRSDTLFS